MGAEETGTAGDNYVFPNCVLHRSLLELTAEGITRIYGTPSSGRAVALRDFLGRLPGPSARGLVHDPRSRHADRDAGHSRRTPSVPVLKHVSALPRGVERIEYPSPTGKQGSPPEFHS